MRLEWIYSEQRLALLGFQVNMSIKISTFETHSTDFCVRNVAVASVLQQEAASTSHLASLEGIVEQLSRFRSQVRSFALARTHVDGSCAKPGLHPDRVPLLKTCDTVRDDLAALGVHIKVQ